MSDSDDHLHDESIDEAIAFLRSVTPPKELHNDNIAAVHRALAHRFRQRWWGKTVAVPVPAAIAATVVFALTATLSVKPFVVPSTGQKVVPEGPQAETVVHHEDSGFGVDNGAGPTWSITQSYIHSLESLNSSKFNWNSEIEEIRDDS